MIKPMVTVARKNSLRLQEEEALRGTKLKKGAHPHLADTRRYDYN